MDSEYILTPDGELYHAGIKGMRWGIRRYQNKDGSLTPAGKKRYNQEVAKLKDRERDIKNRERVKAKQAKLEAKKAELDEREKALDESDESGPSKLAIKLKNKSTPPATSKESISTLSDDELRERTNRLNLEKNYRDALKNSAVANSKKGKKFVTKFSDKFVDAFAEKAGNTAADLFSQTAKSVGAKYLNKWLNSTFGDDIEKVYTNNKNK